MKYFTFDWWNKVQELQSDSSSYAEVTESYRVYYLSIEKLLPVEYQEFKKNYTFHDGSIRNIQVNFQNSEVKFFLYLYSLDKYGQKNTEISASLTYSDVSNFIVVDPHKSCLPPFIGLGDVGYDEIELYQPYSVEQRLLFSSGIEVKLSFKDFSFTELTLV